ncbi:MAG: phosphoribosylanthranilate isomerase [Pirellulales bacterium]|nr:phosphoribosylanthranilate isomerase [Pirellulales bacterium]
MFHIKICGVTNVQDAVAAVDAGADAIGLNFYQQSPRCVTVAQARAISEAIAGLAIDQFEADVRADPVHPVGVFVNHASAYVRQAFREARLVTAQLHGDEPATILDELPEIPVVRVRRLDSAGLAAVADDLKACKAVVASNPALNVLNPCAVLLDAPASGQYGGTGEALPWQELADYRSWLGDTPLILAGGLTPENVAQAIRTVRPAAVDVASGVESVPGKKDLHKLRDFIVAARAAFEA